MENQIIQQLGQTLQSLLPEVKRQVKSLKDFAIFSGATLKMKAPDGLKELIDAKMWYITMKFDGTATREDAKRVFEYTMVEKLGIPRTQQNLDDEILPKVDYPAAPSDAPQLPAPTSTSNQDVIDIDDEGNVKQELATKQPLSAVPVSKYYAVQFKIIGAPRMAGQLNGPRSAGRLGSRRNWSGRQLGMR